MLCRIGYYVVYICRIHMSYTYVVYTCRMHICRIHMLYIYIEFIEINKHKNKLQIYIQQLMAAHIIVDNGYLKIE